MHEEGYIITTDIENAEILNNHFGTLFTSESLNNVPDFNLSYKKKIEVQRTYLRINEQVINKSITNLKFKKSTRMLKMSVDSTIKVLNLIFNRLEIYGEIPCDYKSVNVVSIFKGDLQSRDSK